MTRFCLNLTIAGRLLIAAAIPSAVTLIPAPAFAQNSVSQQAVQKAHLYLVQEKKGREILNVVHTFAAYKGHEVIDSHNLGGGAFSLVYRFYWNDSDRTDIEFRCTPAGYVKGVAVVSTTAWLQQPFLVSTTLVQTIGAALLRSEGENMSESDRAAVRDMIDRADTKALLEASLFLEQVF
jgi:hypothetical protein